MEQASQPQGPVDAEGPAFSRFRSLVDGRDVFREPPLALTPAQNGTLGGELLNPEGGRFLQSAIYVSVHAHFQPITVADDLLCA